MEASSKKLLHNLKVLYLEDEEMTRDELSMFLKRRVGKLITGANGAEGLALFEKNQPDLVITDLKMPVLSGMEFIESLRENGIKVPIIVISALSDSDSILSVVNLGFVKYVVKPVNPKELILTMEEMAEELLSAQGALTGGKLLDKKNKQDLEKKMKSELAHFIKQYTGKGPQDVQAFIQGNQIVLEARQVLTVMEQSMIADGNNIHLSNYWRRVFYIEKLQELEERFSSILETSCKISKIEPDVLQDKDQLVVVFS